MIVESIQIDHKTPRLFFEAVIAVCSKVHDDSYRYAILRELVEVSRTIRCPMMAVKEAP